MWVRSQDKETIVNVDAIKLFFLDNQGWGIFADKKIAPNERTNLGYYSSKEKALKVLDLIVERMNELNKRYITVKPHNEYTDGHYEVMNEAYCDNVVFQMPQDDEV